MNRYYRFFCWAGGGNIEVLNEMSTERNRFFSYGSMICFTALFALLSSLHAFMLLFKKEMGYFAFVPAIIWMLFIFFLDRFFVVSVPNRGSIANKLKLAWPRLVLAAFIGLIISKPLEYRIFKPEILDELRLTKAQLLIDLDTLEARQNRAADKRRSAIKENLTEAKLLIDLRQQYASKLKDVFIQDSTINARSDSATGELHGWAKSGRPGPGRNYKTHLAIMDSAKVEKARLQSDANAIKARITSAEATQLRINKDSVDVLHQAELVKIKSDIDRQRNELITNYEPSILNQEIALGNLGRKNPTAFWTTLFITMLFIFIEMAPMILKLMTKAGAYENRIAQIESTYSTEDRLRRSLDMEEYKSNRGLVRHLARSQRDIIKNAMNSWHEDQLNKVKDDPGYYNDMFNETHDN